VFDTNRDGNFNDTVLTTLGANAFSPGFCQGAAQGRTPADGCRSGEDGNLNYSLRAGYDWQFGNWVVGTVGCELNELTRHRPLVFIDVP